MHLESLFWKLYKAKNESEVEQIIFNNSTFADKNWFPLGENESNYGVVENQQSNPVPSYRFEAIS